jgi:putative transposase
VKRAWTGWVEEAYRLSRRRACRITQWARSSSYYHHRRPKQDPLRMRLRELAGSRVSYGYRRLHVLLRREGWDINHKRVYRLYREEALMLRRRKPRRKRSPAVREVRPAVQRPNQRWAMDFMHDCLADGRSFRVLTIVDVFTRECLVLEARKRFRGEDVAKVLSRLIQKHGRPETIQCDQGTEFTSIALDQWAYWNKVPLDFSRRGKPGDNAVNEAFNGSVRRELLSQHYFLNLQDAQQELVRWRREYNNERPHGSLDQASPVQYREAWIKTEGPLELLLRGS